MSGTKGKEIRSRNNSLSKKEFKDFHSDNQYGLGLRYYNSLSNNIDKIHQLDTVSGATLSNGTVKGRAVQLALLLKAKGIEQRDIVLINSKYSADESIIILATLFIGAVVAPIDIDTTFDDCVLIIGKLKPKICFSELRGVSQMDRVFNKLGIQREIIILGKDHVEGRTMFSSMFSKKELPDFYPVHIEDLVSKIAFIVPTQGTYGPVKLVCLSHVNVINRTKRAAEVFGKPSKLISYYSLPFNDQIIVICCAFENNWTRIIPGNFTERSCCKLIQALRIDLLIMGTNLARQFCRHIALKDFDISSLKMLYVGGTLTSKEELRYFRSTLPKVLVTEVYATQETGLVAAMITPEYGLVKEKTASCGTILKDQKIKIVDIDTGAVLPPLTLGHIYFNGNTLMMGYYKNSKTNYMEKSYYKTEDVGMQDEDGWLYIEGRLGDVVTTTEGGKLTRFTTRELEIVIEGHPMVAECVVVVENNYVVACVCKKPDTFLNAELIKRYVDTRVPFLHRPKRYEFVDDFPKTPTGKIKRYIIQEQVFKQNIAIIGSFSDIRNII